MAHVRVKCLHPNARPPKGAYVGDSGLDLAACLDSVIVIEPGEREMIPTGLAFELPFGHEAQIRPRSSLSAKGIVVAFGTCDFGYRGEYKVVLYNFSNEKYAIHDGDRIAQVVVAPVTSVQVEVVEELTETSRGLLGFGSSGV